MFKFKTLLQFYLFADACWSGENAILSLNLSDKNYFKFRKLRQWPGIQSMTGVGGYQWQGRTKRSGNRTNDTPDLEHSVGVVAR